MSTVKIGDTFRYLDADVVVVSVGSPEDAFPVRSGEVGIRAASHVDAVTLGWSPCTNGEYEAISTLDGFLADAEPSTPTDPSGGAVTSTPAPSDVPSLVELDRREAGERALAALIEWRTAVDVRAHIHATVALRKAADGYYIAAVLS